MLRVMKGRMVGGLWVGTPNDSIHGCEAKRGRLGSLGAGNRWCGSDGSGRLGHEVASVTGSTPNETKRGEEKVGGAKCRFGVSVEWARR